MTLALKLLTSMLLLLGSMSNETFIEAPTSKSSSITIEKLSKKWKLDKYKYFFFSEAPAENERGDYIHLKSDMTFDSVSEGIRDVGNWQLDADKKRIYLTQDGDDEALVFIIDKLKTKKLILIIDDATDPDTKNLKIHFKV